MNYQNLLNYGIVIGIFCICCLLLSNIIPTSEIIMICNNLTAQKNTDESIVSNINQYNYSNDTNIGYNAANSSIYTTNISSISYNRSTSYISSNITSSYNWSNYTTSNTIFVNVSYRYTQ